MNRAIHFLRWPQQIRHPRFLLAHVLHVHDTSTYSNPIRMFSWLDRCEGMSILPCCGCLKVQVLTIPGHTHLYAMLTDTQVLGR